MEQTLREKITAGEGADTATRDVQAAALAVTQLKSAVAVAEQRKQHAEADLKNAEMVARREALREKLIALADLGHTVDTQMAQNGSLAAEVIHLISSIKSFDDPEINSRLVRAGRINT